MRWIQYPTEADREARRNGREREGQVWSDAPGPRRKWVVPEGGGSYALVVVYDGAPEHQNYALGDWAGALP